jgi:D-glycero-D-manno-heptose 1,7-bisphosphate phosphatase
VFIDRDGTLNEMVYDETHGVLDSPRRPEQVRLRPGAGRFLARLRERGFFIVVVSNQPGLAKGTLSPGELEAVNERLAELLHEEGGGWDAFRYCPHHPDPHPQGRPEYTRSCDCRKPAAGLLLEAARDYAIDLPASWMVGDGLVDVQAGRAAGCRTLLLTKLKLDQVERFLGAEAGEPDAVAPDFESALDIIEK